MAPETQLSPADDADAHRKAKDRWRKLPPRVLRFLLSVARSSAAQLDLARAGYDQTEHALGWAALTKVAGARPGMVPCADYEALAAWFQRWSDTARAVVSGHRDLVRLGLKRHAASPAARLPSATALWSPP